MEGIFALLRLFGKKWVSHQIKNTLDHHMSAAGLQNMSADLGAASTALTANNHQAAADALADIVVAIH